MMFGTAIDARADACWDHWRAKLEAVNVVTRSLIRRVKESGDCSYLPKIMASNKNYADILRATPCRDMHKHYDPDPAGTVRERYGRYCKPQAPKALTEEAANSSEATQPPRASSSTAIPKSASCSDITGTNNPAPAATDCKDAKSSLRAARVTRKKYGVYAQEQYKKAAASFRLAGDIGGAEAAEREAKLTDDVFDAQQKDAERATDAKKQQSEGEANEKIAEKIEEGAFEDGSCADLEVAASYYRDAARAFLNAGVYDKASLDVQRDVRLGKIVKKAQAEGLCNRKLSNADRKSLLPPNGGDELADDPNGCAGMRARLTPHAENKAWIDTQMTNSNCHLDGTPMSLQERVKAALEKANP
jgi:hypothetical protein